MSAAVAPMVEEEVLQLGSGGRLFAILSRPVESRANRPVFVFLNAGLLHRVGPSRLHVTLARELAESGFTSLRVDLAGKGDSPSRGPMRNAESVALDFDEIRAGLRARRGDLSMILVGLCSGADNAVRLCQTEPGVRGLLLLDPICFPDGGFRRRALAGKWLNPGRYGRSLKRLVNGGVSHTGQAANAQDDNLLMLRHLPTLDELRRSFQLICERDGRVLSIFTQYALRYYNAVGQLGTVLQLNDYSRFCSELFWPDVEHTYKLEIHRERLHRQVLQWAQGFA